MGYLKARTTRALACLALLASGALAARAGDAPTVTRLFSGTETAAGQPIVLPSGPVQVVFSRYVIPPGATLPVHEHPYARYAYVEAGSLRVTDARTGQSHDYRPGDVIIEMIGLWHSGAALGAEPVRLLVIDQTPPGMQNTILR